MLFITLGYDDYSGLETPTRHSMEYSTWRLPLQVKLLIAAAWDSHQCARIRLACAVDRLTTSSLVAMRLGMKGLPEITCTKGCPIKNGFRTSQLSSSICNIRASLK
jgi:hypothetical protein